MTTAKSITDRRTLLTRALSWPSYQVFLVCFLLGGVFLCFGSFALNIHDLMAPAGPPYSCSAGTDCAQRQVGYLWAPNWSLTYAILGPLSLFLMLESLKGVRNALEYFTAAEMIRDNDMIPLKASVSSSAWQSGTRMRSFLCGILAGAVPALLAGREWYTNNYLRLKAGICRDCQPPDYDWGLAAILKGVEKTPQWKLNASFDLASFFCEAFLIGAAILCFIYLLDLEQVLPGSDGRVKNLLLPDLRSEDLRRGFQKFEEALQLMLNACLVFFLICYCIRINKMYMRSTSSSLGSFMQGEVIDLVKTKIVEHKGSELLGDLLSLPPNSGPHTSEFLGGIALMLVSLFCLGLISLTVGRAARRAKSNALDYYSRHDKSLFGLPFDKEKESAKKMTTWPLEWRYFQLDALLSIVGMALISLWYYRIGFYVVLLVIITLLARFKKVITS